MMKVKNLYMTYIVFDVPAQARFSHSNLNFPAFFWVCGKKIYEKIPKNKKQLKKITIPVSEKLDIFNAQLIINCKLM